MKLGVIGAGNMGSAIIRGYISAGSNPADVIVYGHHADRLAQMKNELGIETSSDEVSLARESDVVLVAVKPKDAADVLTLIAPETAGNGKLVVSIAAGRTLEWLSHTLRSAAPDGEFKIVRVMPNTPAAVGASMTALCRGEGVSDEEYAAAEAVFACSGRAAEVPETLMDAVTGLSGSGPAFVYIFIEALADGAVASGMSRAQAVEFAAQTVLGSAKMVLETGKGPGELKDAVCSPAGTTITGVRELEASAFRSAAMEAVIAAAEKSASM